MSYTVAAKNAMLNALGQEITHASLHDNNPGTNGANELSGGSPAYARKSVTWGSASNGEVSATNQPEFDVPSGATVKFAGLWSAATGGTFYGYGAVAEETFNNQGKYVLTQIKLDLNNDPS